MLDKCPICGEPRLRFSSGVNRFACGTIGPYIKDGEEEYDTGHTCDIHTYSRLFTQMEKERGELQQRLAATEAMLNHALDCVDAVFQKCAENPNPILKNYAQLGADKFEEVKRLASDYAECMEKLAAADAAKQEAFIAGLREYAWWKDGVQYVGSCGTTLEQAIRRVS